VHTEQFIHRRGFYLTGHTPLERMREMNQQLQDPEDGPLPGSSARAGRAPPPQAQDERPLTSLFSGPPPPQDMKPQKPTSHLSAQTFLPPKPPPQRQDERPFASFFSGPPPPQDMKPPSHLSAYQPPRRCARPWQFELTIPPLPETTHSTGRALDQELEKACHWYGVIHHAITSSPLGRQIQDAISVPPAHEISKSARMRVYPLGNYDRANDSAIQKVYRDMVVTIGQLKILAQTIQPGTPAQQDALERMGSPDLSVPLYRRLQDATYDLDHAG
jgi:hypothetical protein